METELLFLGVVLVIIGVLVLGRRSVSHPARSGPYMACGTLLTPGELAFHRILKQAAPAGIWICPKVRVADLVTCAKRDWQRHGRPLTGKHVDFVLTEGDSMRILLAVELDDRSHHRRDRRKRDAVLDTAFAGAGVPLLRIPAAAHYDVREIRRQITQALPSR